MMEESICLIQEQKYAIISISYLSLAFLDRAKLALFR